MLFLLGGVSVCKVNSQSVNFVGDAFNCQSATWTMSNMRSATRTEKLIKQLVCHSATCTVMFFPHLKHIARTGCIGFG